MSIPGDISLAAFFIVAACLIPNAELLIKGVGINPTRTGSIEILTGLTKNSLTGKDFVTH